MVHVYNEKTHNVEWHRMIFDSWGKFPGCVIKWRKWASRKYTWYDVILDLAKPGRIYRKLFTLVISRGRIMGERVIFFLFLLPVFSTNLNLKEKKLD